MKSQRNIEYGAKLEEKNKDNMIVRIAFPSLQKAAAGVQAERLRQALEPIKKEPDTQGAFVSASIEKDNQDTQDIGTIVVLVLGTPAAVAIARGVANFLTRYGAKATISKDGKVVLEHVGGGDMAAILEAITKGAGHSGRTDEKLP